MQKENETASQIKQKKSAGTSARPKTARQIAALVCVILLASMYMVTLVVACLDLGDAGRLFGVCLLMTIALPILLWIFIWIYGKYTEKHTIASLDIMHSGEAEDTKTDSGKPC